jgi:hypothetical protein
MRIHQINPNLALDAAYAAQKAEAKREAAAVRKKLLDSALYLTADDGDVVVSISAEQKNSEEQPKHGKQQQDQNSENGHISDWA